MLHLLYIYLGGDGGTVSIPGRRCIYSIPGRRCYIYIYLGGGGGGVTVSIPGRWWRRCNCIYTWEVVEEVVHIYLGGGGGGGTASVLFLMSWSSSLSSSTSGGVRSPAGA